MHRTRALPSGLFLVPILLGALPVSRSLGGETPALDARATLPGGIRFRHPATWKVERRGDDLALLPPNPNPLGEPPVYVLAVAPRGDVTRPDDPRVIAGVEKRTRASAPYLQRKGAVVPILLAGGRGVVATWEGTDPGGLAVRARIYVGLVGDRLVFLAAKSGRFVLERHEPVLDAIFRSLEAPAAASPFAGTFVGDRLRVTLEVSGTEATGRIELGGKTYPLRAEIEGRDLKGEFESGPSAFPFTATLAGDVLTLRSGGATHTLKREGGATAPAPAPKPPAATPTPSASADLAALGALGPPRPDPAREWTIVVYLDGDNDLEPFALRDLVEMEFGLPPQGVEVLVLIDRAKGFYESAGDWTDARVYRVRADKNTGRIASEILARPGEVNMGDPKTLSTFLGAALRAFPARKKGRGAPPPPP
ncbi:MAG: clostripain-related cysteine peptidase, partial [Planctomycetota bacterium]